MTTLAKNKKFSFMDMAISITDSKAKKMLEKAKWGNTPVCSKCGCDKTYKLNITVKKENKTTNGVVYKCSNCYSKFTVFQGTIMANTKISTRVWVLMALYVAVNKKTKSSRQFSKDFGITQKTMWQIHNNIRRCLYQDFSEKMDGVVEVDECFVSKTDREWSWGGISSRKGPILGLFDRKTGRIVVKKVPSRKYSDIAEIIKENVSEGSTLYTDGYALYKVIADSIGYDHAFVNHSSGEYVRGDVHTNNIENTWGQMKRHIRGSHHSVSDKHLQGYIDEVVYKINTKDWSDERRFNDILKRMVSNMNRENQVGYKKPK